METGLQGSLLDLCDEPAPGPLGASVRRTMLGHGAWVDFRPGWMAGADVLFERLRDAVPWREERRRMYDRVVEVPRLLCFYGEGEGLPDPALDEARRALDRHYGEDLGEPFCTAGLCLYRDGRDSVAIISLGTPRALALRPRGGGSAIRHDLGHGDLLVMGGSCQRTWEHAVPKTARPAGPRISVQFRPHGVR